MRGTEYTIEVWHNGQWAFAHRSVMSRGCADGMLNQFGQDYRARLVNMRGKVLGHRGVVTDQLDRRLAELKGGQA